jgi:nucleolar complex protein 2
VIKTVYNWQYILGLYLWASVLIHGKKYKGEAVELIQELLHSLIQITIGLIEVFNAPRYIPIRLHCIRVLLQIQVNCDVYIPTMSLTAGVSLFP